MKHRTEPAVWFPTIRTNSGTDHFTIRLMEGLQSRGLRSEISWLPHRAEYLPWTIQSPAPPSWANVMHVNTWLPKHFLSGELSLVATMHHSVHDPAFGPYKSLLQTFYHRFWIKSIEQNMLNQADKVIAVSQYTAAKTYEAFKTSPIEVIYNGIDLKKTFLPIEREHPHHPFRLVYVGNWSLRKGTDLLAPIIERLGPNFELHYTTNNPNKRPAGLPANTQNQGCIATTEEVVQLYRSADALIFPTRLEGLGYAALEAQACGLPVISTRCSALPEAVIDGTTGFLCQQDNIAEFVDAARKLSNDRELWLRMSKAARLHVEKLFDIETMIDRHIDLYDRLLNAD